jgi:hypothetical protein
MQNFINYFGKTIRTQNAIYVPAGDGKVSFVDGDITAVVTEILLIKNNGTKVSNNIVKQQKFFLMFLVEEYLMQTVQKMSAKQ